MYHRYQPTESGEFRRRTVNDISPAPRKEHSPPPTASPLPKPPETAPSRPTEPPKDPASLPPPRFQLPFLEKLLPNADNGDLLLLLIMLLLLSEGNEDASSVVMTLAIFLFLQ